MEMINRAMDAVTMETKMDSPEGAAAFISHARACGLYINQVHIDLAHKHGVDTTGVLVSRPIPTMDDTTGVDAQQAMFERMTMMRHDAAFREFVHDVTLDHVASQIAERRNQAGIKLMQVDRIRQCGSVSHIALRRDDAGRAMLSGEDEAHVAAKLLVALARFTAPAVKAARAEHTVH